MNGHQQRQNQGEQDHMANIETDQSTLSHCGTACDQLVRGITDDRGIRGKIGAHSDSPESDLIPR